MSYHFIGIGGIGMSGLAKLLHLSKKKVKGSDVSSSFISTELKALGIEVFSKQDEENVKDEDIVVYSSAIKPNNPELLKAKKNNNKLLHRSELLNYLMKDKIPILISGVHGKTTTTSLFIEVLINAKLNPSYAVGGILSHSNTNAFFSKESKYFVAEADESDGSFLNYEKKYVIVNNLEAEHLDYWESYDNLKNGFSKFLNNIDKSNIVFYGDDTNLSYLNLPAYQNSFGFSDKNHVYATNIKNEESYTVFDIHYKNKIIKNVTLNLLGFHNVLNALAVFTLAKKLNIKTKVIIKTFFNFKGVKRRLEKIGAYNDTIFYEDYAHHPTEIKATLTALRNCAKERRIIAVFQPHKYSRTHFFLNEFSKSFQDADEVYIADIFSANEKNIYDISSKKLTSLMKKASFIEDFDSLLQNIYPHDIVVFLGAGNINQKGRELFSKYIKKSTKYKIALIYGGKSLEHDISKISAKAIYENLDKTIYDIYIFYISKKGDWYKCSEDFTVIEHENSLKSMNLDIFQSLTHMDIAFPILHGPFGEDGMLQGFFETLNIACVGNDYLSSPVCMNKAFTKNVAKAHGINLAKGFSFTKNMWEKNKQKYFDRCLEKLSFPIYLKPSHLGSSYGIKKIVSKEVFKENFFEFVNLIFKIDNSLVIEEEIKGQEIETAVLGNEIIEVALPGEILTEGEFYDFEKKYGENGFATKVPANLSTKEQKKVKALALEIYKIFEMKGMARIDFFYKNKKFYLNEINPIPGFTEISLYPKMWKESSVNYKTLLKKLIILAIHKKRENILSILE